MPHSEISELIPAPSSAVFDLVHDYRRRLEWDTLLQAAYLDDGANVAAKGVTAVCVGRKSLGSIALKTVYVTFERPTVAAVRMVNAPAFFQSWAPSIRHEDISTRESSLTYKFQFTARPSSLQFMLDPLMQRVFVWETKKRLQAQRATASAPPTEMIEEWRRTLPQPQPRRPLSFWQRLMRKWPSPIE